MSAFDDRMVARAAALIDARGKPVTITSVTSATYNRSTRSNTQTTLITTPKVLMTKPPRRTFGDGGEWQAGTEAKRDTKAFYLAGNQAEPSMGSTVDFDNQRWIVANVIPDYVGERVVLWTVTIWRA
jgi:hypothetical protein